MLQGLKRADELSELHAGLQVVERDVERLKSCAQHFRCLADACTIKRIAQQTEPAVHRTKHVGYVNVEVVELQICLASGVNQLQWTPAETWHAGGNKKQGNSVGLAAQTG